MLLDAPDPDACPNCQLTGIDDNLVYCPRCGWRLKGQLEQLLNFVPLWLILIVCLSLSLYAGRLMTIVQSWSPETEMPSDHLDLWAKFMIFCAYVLPFESLNMGHYGAALRR